MRKVYRVKGMSCVNCARTIEIALKRLRGVKEVRVSFELGRVEVEYDPGKVSEEEIAARIRDLGYLPEEEKDKKEELLLGFSLLSSFLFLLLMIVRPPYGLEVQLLLSGLVQFTAGLKFYRGALYSLREGTAGMDVLVSLGTTGSYVYSLLAYLKLLPGTPFFETNVFLITFVRAGKYIEERAKERAIRGLKEFISSSYSRVRVLSEGREVEKEPREVVKGEKIVLRSGDEVLLDGKVLEGEAYVSEAVITGESRPLLKKKGDLVYSGSVVESGYLLVEVVKSFERSYLSQLRSLAEEALRRKPRIQRLADRVSHYFVYGVVSLSLLTLLYWLLREGDLQKAVNFSLALLVVSCPCAFGIAVPLAVSLGLYEALRRGVFLKSSEVFERVPKVNTVIFDKTGTLTEGKFRVERYEVREEEALEKVYYMEQFSGHPIARSLREFLKDKVKREVSLEGCREIKGVGVRCGEYVVGKGELWGISPGNGYKVVGFGRGKKLLALFYLRDTLREEARTVVSFLKEKGLEVVMLTGDEERNALGVARELGIDRVIANVRPEEKLKVVEEFQRRGRKVLMVGDGVNDAPALARADVGVAVAGGTDLAKLSGSVLVTSLKKIPLLFGLSEKVYRKIKENLFWAFVYNIVAMPVAAGFFYEKGLYLRPELAGLIMSLSSVSVVLNTLRLKRGLDF
ncbi:MAG: cadmium-translocating P-type ATPase [Aquificae bacterium]|nr:cadmium-translocating P-type ATPase [Aquificota bacterium]